MKVLIVNEEDLATPKIDEVEENIDEEIKSTIIDLVIELVAGNTTPKTLKFLSEVLREEVIILIDSGYTHNFIFRTLLNNGDYKL